MTDSAVGYAFVLGMVALLNPCGFPLLPVYLASFVGDPRAARGPRIAAGLRAGVAVTAGFLAVFAGAGLVAGSLHAVIMAVAPWLMVVVAAGILGFGILALSGKTLPIRVLPGFRPGRGFVAMAGFGIAYAIGSLSCSLPVFVAAVGAALASGSPVLLGASLAAYGLGMGLFATVLALVASLAGAVTARPLRHAATVLPRVAGGVCILVGGYLVAFWVGRVGGVDLTRPVTSRLDAVQSFLATVIEAAWIPIGAALVVTVLGVLVWAARAGRASFVGASDVRTTGRDAR